jgi:hypothetical protein
MSSLMRLMCSRRCGGAGLAWAGALGLVLVGVSVQAGEPIEFSTPSSQNSLPSASKNEPRPDRDLHLFKSSSEGPGIDLPANSQSEAVPSKRRMQEFWEKRDRERNWIFVPPSDFGAMNSSPERMFDVETAEGSSRPIKGSKVMWEFWQSQDTKERSYAKTPGDDSLPKRDASEAASGSGPLFGQASHEAAEKAPLDWSKLFEGHGSGDSLKASAGESSGSLFDQVERSVWLFSDDTSLSGRSRSRPSNRKDNSGDFQKLLKAQPGSSGLFGASDPLNTAVDATRQPINPVVSRGLRDPTEAFQMQNAPGGLPSAGFGSGGYSVSSFVDFNGNGLSPAGRSPSMFPSAEPLSLTPKPTTFEFPKRKF